MDKNETYLTEKALAETPAEAIQATDALLKSFSRTASRRNMLKGALAAAGGTMLASSPLIASAVHAQSLKSASLATEVFTIAATAETLAVTFYNNTLRNAWRLGLRYGSYYESLEYIAYEEDVHRTFFINNGGKVLTSTFSFPRGEETFRNRRVWLETQQQLEAVFDSAFLLAVKGFAAAGAPDVAQIAAQIACVEQGHLVYGRMANWLVAEPYVFAPVLFTAVDQIVPTVTKAGYLSPKGDNSFTYHPAMREPVVDTMPGGMTVLNAL